MDDVDVKQYRQIKREIFELERLPRPKDKAEQKRAATRLAALRKQLVEIENAIDALEDPDERTVMRLRYIQGLRWEAIAMRMYYGRTTVFRIANRAEEHLAQKGKKR